MMKSTLKFAAAALLASTCAVPAAMAVNFVGNYTVTANSSDPGLVVQTSNSQPSLNFNLNVGDSTTFDLFDIWTDETYVNADDTVAKPISVAFSFTNPDLFGGNVDGSTVGQSVLFGLIQYGQLTWDNGGNATLDFWGGGGKLGVHLDDVIFNKGFFGLKEGESHGGTVEATFTLSAIPEPATWLTMIAGFGMIGAAMRRRRAIATVAA